MDSLSPLTAVTVLCSALAPLQSAALDDFTEAHRGHLAAQLPNASIKLETKSTLHVTFLGDAAMLEVAEGENGLIRTFLSELQKSFYYTGGVHDVYDDAPLDLPGGKITFEAITLPDPAAPNLVQHASTVAFVNDPDLLVLCAGAGDTAAGVDVQTQIRFFDQLLTLTRSHHAELVVLGPPLVRWNDQGMPTLSFTSRPYAASLRRWSSENRIPYFDPNHSLLRRSLPYRTRDQPADVLARLKSSAEGTARGSSRPGAFGPETQRGVGKALFRFLIGADPLPRYSLTEAELSGGSGPRASVATTLALDTSTSLTAHVFPLALGSSQEPPGTTFEVTPNQPLSLRLSLPSQENGQDARHLCRGRRPFSLLIIDPFRLEIHDLSPPVSSVGVVWKDHALHNLRGDVEVRCDVLPFASNLTRLPYTLRYDGAESSGTIAFAGGQPSTISWTFALPKSDEDSTIQGALELLLGEDGSVMRVLRNFEAIRQFGLNQPVPLTRSNGNHEPAEENPLRIPELLLTAEATPGDLMLHFDFKNIAFASAFAGPVIDLNLAIDARSHTERNQLGFVGNLSVQATADDGPAEVGSFADQAHFGNGYARRPLPSGARALLSTRPNGMRRLTIHMARGYFYRHPWSLGNGNSQLGINSTVTLREGGPEEPPTMYRLTHSPLHLNNAESLAVLELTEKSTQRWSVRFW